MLLLILWFVSVGWLDVTCLLRVLLGRLVSCGCFRGVVGVVGFADLVGLVLLVGLRCFCLCGFGLVILLLFIGLVFGCWCLLVVICGWWLLLLFTCFSCLSLFGFAWLSL